MSDRRPTELELANALRAHLPTVARADLRERVAADVADTHQQRPWPWLLGALSDADPLARRRALLLAAAALLAVALAGAAAAGALQLWRTQQPLAGATGLVAFTRDGDLYVGRPDDSQAVMLAHLDGRSLEGPRWSADGRWIAVQTEEPSILALDVQTGKLRRLASGWAGAWSPVAPSLAYRTRAGDLAIHDLDQAESRILVPAQAPAGAVAVRGTFDISSLRWSPEGRQLVIADISAADGRPRLVRIDAATGAITDLAPPTAESAAATWGTFSSSWAPEGDRIAYSLVTDQGSPDSFLVASIDGTQTREIRDPDGMVAEPAWSPDGQWLAYRSTASEERGDRLMLVRPDGSDRRILASDVTSLVGWSPDGGAFAYTVVAPRSLGQPVRVAFHVVSVADGADRVVPSVADSYTYAWWAPTGAAGDRAISLPSPLPTAAPDEPHEAPAATAPVEPDASWGRVAFMRDGDDCAVSNLRFPDDLVTIDTTRGVPAPSPAPTTAVDAGASPAPIASSDYCEVRFAPDGSAFARSSGARGSFTIFRSDGSASWGPFKGTDTRWSRGSDWLASLDCEPETCAKVTIMRADGSDRREVPGMPSWSPGDRSLAVRTPGGRLLIGDPDGTNLKDVGDLGLPAAWAPDGEMFVFLREGDAWLARADGTGVRNLTEFEVGGANNPSWSPDGRWIAVQQGSAMWLLSPDGATRERLSSTGGAPAWSSDGRWLAFEGAGSNALLVDLDDRRTYDVAGVAPAFSPDGRHLAVVDGGGENGSNVVDVMNADGTGRRTVATGVGASPVAWISR